MDLSKIITIAGRTGLHRVVAQGRQALIVESLADGKRTPVHTSVRVSSLEEISMFTTGDDVPLAKVLEKLHEVEKGGESLDARTATVDELFARLGQALPEHDRERIYASDVRKLFTWYAELHRAGAFAVKAEKVEEPSSDKPKAAKRAGAKDGAKKAGAEPAVKKTAVPKAGAGSKPKATAMRKSAQRGA